MHSDGVDQDLTTLRRPGLQTRPSNTLKHPGKVVTDQIKHRRTHSQVVAERALIEEKKSAEAAERYKRIREAAAIQLQLEVEMVMFNFNSKHLT